MHGKRSSFNHLQHRENADRDHKRVANLFASVGKPDRLKERFSVGAFLVEVVADVIVAELKNVKDSHELRKQSSLRNVECLTRREKGTCLIVTGEEVTKVSPECCK